MSTTTQEEHKYQHEGIFVVEHECKFAADNAKAEVMLEHEDEENFANAITELGSAAARNLALRYASEHGMGAVGINGNVIGPFAVNSRGQDVQEVKDAEGKPLPPRHPLRQPHRYRAIVTVARRLM